MTTQRTSTRLLSTIALGAVLGLGLAACGSDDDETRPLPGDSSLEMDGNSSSSPSASPSSGTYTDPEDEPIDDETRQRLEQVALDEVGDGRVDDVERSDDSTHAYEVDIDLPNDEDVTVEIAEDFSVVRVDR